MKTNYFKVLLVLATLIGTVNSSYDLLKLKEIADENWKTIKHTNFAMEQIDSSKDLGWGKNITIDFYPGATPEFEEFCLRTYSEDALAWCYYDHFISPWN